MLASGGAGSELLSIWGRLTTPTRMCIDELVTFQHFAPGHWARGTLQQAYLEKKPLSALVAFAIAGGWDQTSFMRRHLCGRSLVRFQRCSCSTSHFCSQLCLEPKLHAINHAYLNSGCRSWCQSTDLTACFLGCAKRWKLSERGMHGFSLASSRQMTGSLRGQLRAS